MRVWSGLPARPATARRKPGFAELLHFISPLRVRPAACAGLFGRSRRPPPPRGSRSEKHTSELQSLMRISFAVFCLKKKRDKDDDPQHCTIIYITDSKFHT